MKGHYGFKVPFLPLGFEFHRDYHGEYSTGVYHFWNDPAGCYGIELQWRGWFQVSAYRRIS